MLPSPRYQSLSNQIEIPHCLEVEGFICPEKTFKCSVCGCIEEMPKGGIQAHPDEEKIKCCNHDTTQEGAIEHMAATLRCTNCDENFCVICRIAHQLVPSAKSHVFVNLNALATVINCHQNLTLQPRLTKMIVTPLDIIEDITEHNNMLIVVAWSEVGYEVFVYPPDLKESRALKDRIIRACPEPYRVQSLYPFKDVVAVLDYTQNEIQFVSTLKDQIESVDLTCIDYPYTFALTPQGQLVYIDSLVAKPIKVIEHDNSVRTILHLPGNDKVQTPWYFCVNSKGHTIISDCDKHEVIIIDDKGKVIGKYKDLKKGELVDYPCGLCLIRNDDILVCDRGNHSVTHLNSSGKFVAQILSDLDAICLDFKDPNLYVGLADGVVLVYELY